MVGEGYRVKAQPGLLPPASAADFYARRSHRVQRHAFEPIAAPIPLTMT
jgi:hypothetical protein